MKQQAFFVLVMAALLLSGCAGNKRLSTTNLAFLYKTDEKALNPEFSVFHKDAVTSEIHFILHSENLLYARPNAEGKYMAQVKVKYELYKSFDQKEVSDSSSVTLTDTSSTKTNKEIFGSIPLDMPYPGDYILKLSVYDLNRNRVEKNIMIANKSNYGNRQNFMVTDAVDGTPVLSPFFANNREVKITYHYKPANKFFVDHFQRDFPLPPPPHSNTSYPEFDYLPDSSFQLEVSDSNTARLKLEKHGIYHIKTQKSVDVGLSLFRLTENYPKAKSTTDLVRPVRYICSSLEYDQMIDAENQKEAFDKFWLSLGGSEQRAKILIKNYYHRVEEANQYFTSFVPGWKTDRGMVYIVYGPPSTIYKKNGTETWIYGEQNSPVSLNFNFVKVDNPFSNNDFRLTRSPLFKNSWYTAVDRWRNGQISDQY